MYDLKEIIQCPIERFNDIVQGEVIETKFGPLIYKDNGGSVLAVAHLDFVLDQTLQWIDIGAGDKVYFSPALDDRLGAWVILTLAEQLGFDLLFTDSEEIGRSTGEFFEPKKQYNWMFQFDRADNDVVMYKYETPELRNLLTRYNFTVGMGSFSDISSMGHLGCAGFNFGVGYTEQHTAYCHCVLSNVIRQMEKFCVFFKDHKDTRFEYTKPPESFYSSRYYSKYFSDYLGAFGFGVEEEEKDWFNDERFIYLRHLGQFVDTAELDEDELDELHERELEYLINKEREDFQ